MERLKIILIFVFRYKLDFRYQCLLKFHVSKMIHNFYSFFALEDVEDLSLKGFKYELDNYFLSHTSPLGVSNEIVKEEATLSYSKGKLLLIKTKE